ncbi:hypothetical protein BD413DRAFT_286508 [Trametes elegans]|nr:hypothetical protein BD413DRAFT_286508 [Trametes elegans]
MARSGVVGNRELTSFLSLGLSGGRRGGASAGSDVDARAGDSFSRKDRPMGANEHAPDYRALLYFHHCVPSMFEVYGIQVTGGQETYLRAPHQEHIAAKASTRSLPGRTLQPCRAVGKARLRRGGARAAPRRHCARRRASRLCSIPAWRA